MELMLADLFAFCVFFILREYIFADDMSKVFLFEGNLLLRFRAPLMFFNNVRSGIFIVNIEHTSHLVLVFLLLTLNM